MKIDLSQYFERTVATGFDIAAMRAGIVPPLCVDADTPNAQRAQFYDIESLMADVNNASMADEVVVPVEGAFTWRPSKDGWYYGRTVDTETLTQLVNQLAENDKVEAVRFMVDSPGGDARGIQELHQAVKACAAKKPTTAVNTGMMCSAAYYGMAGATAILNEHRNTNTGSIGCYSMLFSMSDMLRSMGFDVQLVSSGGVKGHGSPLIPISAEYKAQHQAMVNDLADEFRTAVSGSRSSVQKETAFNGFYWMHDNAHNLGLVDGLYETSEEGESMKEEMLAAINALTAKVDALETKMSDGGEPAPVAAAPAPAVEQPAPASGYVALLMDLGTAQGKITAGNAPAIKCALSELSVEAGAKLINGLPVLTKTGVASDPRPQDTDDRTSLYEKHFPGQKRYHGANSYSLTDLTMRRVGMNQRHGDADVIHMSKAKPFSGALGSIATEEN